MGYWLYIRGKRMFRHFIAGAALLLFGVSAHAACSNSTVVGTWGYHYTSFDFNLGSFCSGVGNLIFSNKGTVRIVGGKTSCNGSIFSETGSGRFSIASSCLGTVSATFSTGGSARYYLTITSGGKEADFILGANGVTVSGIAKKQ